ncbi:MAG: TVP38/TMEM64 family protein [Planctomycetes bacterium]|nr:TVP38/TMEM64 family protein [Planctomycetota bacterium]
MGKNLKRVILLVALAVLVASIFVLPLKDWLVKGLEWAEGLGFWGPVFVVAFYMVACVLFLPGSVLTIGTGFVFKILVGAIIASIGSTLGACAAFLVGRTVARGWISRKIAANSKFAAIDNAISQQGFKIVFLIRLSPVLPFNFLNYAFGLTKVSFAKYALASWIGMFPGTLMYVYFGAGLRSFADVAAGQVETGIAGRVFFWFGMAATVAVTVFVTHLARRALKEAISE